MKLHYRTTTNSAGRREPSANIVTLSFSQARVGQSVEERLFQFSPPEGALQVEHLSFGPKYPLVGMDSPDFELKGTDGRAITSAHLRGNVLLLQFGSRPNDDSRLFLEMTYRSLKGNGLTAIYVPNAQYGPHTGGELYTVPVAFDPDGSVAKKFGIGTTGTVLIDRQGKITYIDTFFWNSSELAHALQKAGVW
jgi:hypothetical protein